LKISKDHFLIRNGYSPLPLSQWEEVNDIFAASMILFTSPRPVVERITPIAELVLWYFRVIEYHQVSRFHLTNISIQPYFLSRISNTISLETSF
jgi:hypothetical protein